MKKPISCITAIAIMIAAVVSLKYTFISRDVASKTRNQMAPAAHIEMLDLSKKTGGLLAQQFPAF